MAVILTPCGDPDAEHQVWCWIENPHDPIMLPHQFVMDNRSDALKTIERLVEDPPIALRWIKCFRSDNEMYMCFWWENPTPYPVQLEVDPPTIERRCFWGRWMFWR